MSPRSKAAAKQKAKGRAKARRARELLRAMDTWTHELMGRPAGEEFSGLASRMSPITEGEKLRREREAIKRMAVLEGVREPDPAPPSNFEIKFLEYPPPSPLRVALAVYRIARDHRKITKTHGKASWMAEMPWRGRA